MKNKLSKKGQLKKAKQKLINKINSCKTLKELRGWEKTFSYHSILKNDEDWDYGFLFNLIEFKLKRMSQYFHTHYIVENEDWYGTLCDRAINILHAGYKTDVIIDSDLKDTYVNVRNAKRFFIKQEWALYINSDLDKYFLSKVREEKAKRLFWKFMNHYIELLWD